MKIKEFADLPAFSRTTDTYQIQKSLGDFGIPFEVENNTEVSFETIMEEGDGYRGAWIQKIVYKDTVVGITYQQGRGGDDGYGYYVINVKLFKEMINYLKTATLDFEYSNGCPIRMTQKRNSIHFTIMILEKL